MAHQGRSEILQGIGESNEEAMVSSPRRLAWILTLAPERLGERGQHWLRYLCQDSTIEKAHDLAQRFVEIVMQHSAESFEGWYQPCIASDLVWFSGFASRLWTDREAVEAATRLPWSNGQVEGQINRLKFIKRQMYGRAGFALLRQRVLYRSE